MERDLVSKNLIIFPVIGKARAVKYPSKNSEDEEIDQL